MDRKKEAKRMREKLTKSDVEKIQAEIEHRKLVERKELIEAVKEARSHGDLSENFEYHAAKKEKNRNESRIRYLERMLKTALSWRIFKGLTRWDLTIRSRYIVRMTTRWRLTGS